jgi:Periplasmic component of the Tol biopolymer transport system
MTKRLRCGRGAVIAALLAVVGLSAALPAAAKQARGREEQNQGSKGGGSGSPPAREREEEKQQEQRRGGDSVIVIGDGGDGSVVIAPYPGEGSARRSQGRIVFTSDRERGDWELFLLDGNAGRGRVRRLTKRQGEEKQPRFSPDGRRIVFVARESDPFRGAAEGLWVLDVDNPGGSVRQLTVRRVGADADPAWSPDGGRVFFTSDRDGNREIYSVNAQTGDDLRRLTNDPADDAQPCVSPDGRTVLFVSARGGAANRRIWRANATDGTDAQPLTLSAPALARLPLEGEGDFATPVYSPDGSRIAFFYGSGDHYDLYTVAADGTDLRRLTRSASFGTALAWSPDGAYLAFTSDRDGSYGVFVVHATQGEGAWLARLTDKRSRSGHADWRY